MDMNISLEEVYGVDFESDYVFVDSLSDISDRPITYLGNGEWKDAETKKIYIVG